MTYYKNLSKRWNLFSRYRENDVLDYRQQTTQSILSPNPTLEDDGWSILAGNPCQSVRFDCGAMGAGPVLAVWRCTPGKIRKSSHPFNEFVTVLDGEVIATLDEESLELHRGDSFFVPKGGDITWEIKRTVTKCLMACGDGPLV